MKKFSIVIEVEVQEDTEITPDVVRRAYGTHTNYHELVMDPQWVADAEHEKVLLASLRSSPTVYDEFIKSDIISRLESISFNEICRLAGISRDSYLVLSDLLEKLPSASRKYFQQAIEDGVFSESTYLTTASFQVTLNKITLENTATSPPD
ncbi:hypothetical protein [Hymenobacter glacieicola]|uniref:HTH araC/xylS-type domain-containing protein n=1 Tax=Hymenobacter glacieicola TaxID=1562124 RepID=A0ABQ1X4F5_9BACT|nr:hypothetical protein [Hymenobacter glacieicola]GGG59474.1 hypothetical protein GCM10011378_39330 [Hymenobacter glacieicola]